MFEQLLRSLLGPPLLLHETLASPERRHFGAQLTVLPPGLPLDPVSLPELEQLTVAVQTQTAALAAAGLSSPSAARATPSPSSASQPPTTPPPHQPPSSSAQGSIPWQRRRCGSASCCCAP